MLRFTHFIFFQQLRTCILLYFLVYGGDVTDAINSYKLQLAALPPPGLPKNEVASNNYSEVASNNHSDATEADNIATVSSTASVETNGSLSYLETQKNLQIGAVRTIGKLQN